MKVNLVKNARLQSLLWFLLEVLSVGLRFAFSGCENIWGFGRFS